MSWLFGGLYTAAVFCCACPGALPEGNLWAALAAGLGFGAASLFPRPFSRRTPSRRLRICAGGCRLLEIFLLSAFLTFGYQLSLAFRLLPEGWREWGLGVLWAVLAEALVFWNGILRVYLTSVQLGIKLRVTGILCGWIPGLNLWALWRIIRTAEEEVRFEREKLLLDEARREERICATRYPLLLVHGVFFRDSKALNYWGRIPGELEKNGARIFYGNHQSAASVADSAAELAARIREIVETTGCGKVNIIAHSKGGLDCRWALSRLGAASMAASLTTVNSPHRGCIFADYLLEKIPPQVQQSMAAGYNAALKKLGDRDPDFMAAVRDLTASACRKREALLPPEIPGVFCQSVGSRLDRAVSGKFPLNVSYPLVKHFDGENDGLVSVDSFPWGEKYTFLTAAGKRGISHGDMVDLNRENIPGFDVREFYVRLAADLKDRGL